VVRTSPDSKCSNLLSHSKCSNLLTQGNTSRCNRNHGRKIPFTGPYRGTEMRASPLAPTPLARTAGGLTPRSGSTPGIGSFIPRPRARSVDGTALKLCRRCVRRLRGACRSFLRSGQRQVASQSSRSPSIGRFSGFRADPSQAVQVKGNVEPRRCASQSSRPPSRAFLGVPCRSIPGRADERQCGTPSMRGETLISENEDSYSALFVV
jgi:hypothetical protein